MSTSTDHSLILVIGLGLLGMNVLCVIVLLVVQPAVRQASQTGDLTRALLSALRASLAELVGTFVLILAALLVAVTPAAAGHEPPGLLVIALAQGAVLTAMLAGPGTVSGGHFNPAVTFGLVFVGRIPLLRGLGYVTAQAAGATAAACLVAWLFGSAVLQQAVPAPADGVPLRTAFVLEALAGLAFMLVYACNPPESNGPPAAAASGAALVGCVLVLAPLTGGVLNPVRFFAPSLVGGHPGAWVVYLASPCIGCIAGAALVQLFRKEEAAPEKEPAEEPESRLAA